MSLPLAIIEIYMAEKETPTRVLFLFDVDGTLTPWQNPIQPSMVQLLSQISSAVDLAVVGGSGMAKITEQLTAGVQDSPVMRLFQYIFAENGTMAYRAGQLVARRSIADFLGEERLKEVLNFVLRYFSEMEIPVKRGHFVDYRNGMLNFSPIGRACSQQERDQFFHFDAERGLRLAFKAALEERFSKYDLCFAIGGQISIDCYPKGWDKTYCLQMLENYPVIHFFGDRTDPVAVT